MPQYCYLAKGAKRPSHITNTIKFDRIPFDPSNSIKRFDLCPFDQKNSAYLQPPEIYKFFLCEFRNGRKTQRRKCIKCQTIVTANNHGTSPMHNHRRRCDTMFQKKNQSNQSKLPFCAKTHERNVFIAKNKPLFNWAFYSSPLNCHTLEFSSVYC